MFILVRSDIVEISSDPEIIDDDTDDNVDDVNDDNDDFVDNDVNENNENDDEGYDEYQQFNQHELYEQMKALGQDSGMSHFTENLFFFRKKMVWYVQHRVMCIKADGSGIGFS